MATIGSITIAFDTDISKLSSGVASAVSEIESIKSAVEGISASLATLSGKTLEIKASVGADTSSVKKAAQEVKELGDEIENESPTVKIRTTGSIGRELFEQARGQVKSYGESLVELSKETAAAAKSSASAVSAVGDVLGGASTSVSGLIVAVGRSEKAIRGWQGAIASAAAATGAFVLFSGGLRTAIGAVSGNVGASARILAAFGAAAGAATASVATFSAIMAVTRVAVSGLSQEAQQYVTQWVSLGAATAAAAVGLSAAGVSFSVVYRSLQESSTAAEFFANALKNASASVGTFAAEASKYMMGVFNVMTLARVASGEFRDSLAKLGAQAEGIRNMADRFGATVEQMLILEYAARAASVGMSQLARASQAFFTSVSKVKIGQLGTAEAQEAKFAFDRLQISLDDLRNKSPQKVFALVADRLVSVEDAADRAAIAFDLFGRQAVNVLPALKGLREAEADSRRLGTTLSGINFSMFEDVDTAFDRAAEAAANFGEVTMSGFAPLQAGVANIFADLVGGLASFSAPFRAVAAAITVPFQQFLEILARVINIMLRLAGAAATVFTAFLDAPALAGPWRILGDTIKGVLTYVEQFVDVVEDAARALFSEVNPALKDTATAMDKVLYVIQGFATVTVLGGIFQAIGASFRIDFLAILQRGYELLRGLNWAAAFSMLRRVMQYVLFDSVAAAQTFVANWILAGVRMISGFVQPFIAQVAVIITGNAAMATSALVTGYSMAAAWVIGTLGLAALIPLIVAVIQNFDKLYDYFSNFGENVSKLFTLEGLAEAASAVANAIVEAFKSAFGFVSDFFGGLIQNIVLRVRGIKTPEKIDASNASVADVIGSRKRQQSAVFESRATMSSAGFGPSPKPIAEDYDGLSDAVKDSRDQMLGLSFEAARFGEAGRKSFLAARTDFAKLQQQLANDTLKGKTIIDEDGLARSETAIETFNRRYQEIQKSLRENLSLADTISPEQFQQSAEEMVKTVEETLAAVRKVGRGQDTGSTLSVDRFFPTSEAIKEKAAEFAASYEAELRGIEEALARGEYGSGQEALKKAARERESAKDTFDRSMSKIDADVSFAADIRKSLEDAFLKPLEKYEKRLREISQNQSLTDAEKTRATAMEQKQMVEGTFGKSAGQSLREKEAMLGEATASGAFNVSEGSAAAGAARAAAERNKLDMERRSSAGLDATPAQELKAGLDRINDAFGVTGKSMAEIQASLSPKEFAEYREAIKKNRDTVLQSIGVERSAVAVRAEAEKKLASLAGKISSGAKFEASQKINDSFMAALGVTKTPFEQFGDSLDNIAAKFGMAGRPIDEVRKKLQGNAKDLELLERAVKQARDAFLADLGVEKTPQQVFEEQMKKIDEAAASTDKEKRLSPEQATQARINATRKRDEALGGESANDFGSRIAEQRRKINESYGATGENDPKKFKSAMKDLDEQRKQVIRDFGRDGKKDPEKFKTAMSEIDTKRKQINEDFGGAQKDPEKFKSATRKLNESIPGAEKQSPVQKFQEDLERLRYAFGEGTAEFNQGKLNLQAQLQEDLKPALDSTKADRRGIEASDARSKGGVDTFFRILRGNDNPSLKAQLEVARNTKILADASKNKDAAPAIAQLSPGR
jgi:hypothetical protein